MSADYGKNTMTWPKLGDWAWVEKMPSTNFRIFVTVLLEVIYVLVILLLLGLNVQLQADIVFWLGVFITAWLGIDVAQFRIKRKTHTATPTASQEPAQP